MILVRFLPDPAIHARDMLVLFAPVVAVYLFLWLAIGGLLQIYGRYVLSYSRALIASLVGFLVISTLTYLYRDVAYSRLVLVLASALVAITLPGWRLLVHLRQITHKVGDSYRAGRPSIFSRRTIILGAGEEGRRIANLLLKRPDKGLDILGFVDNTGVEVTGDDLPLALLGRTQDIRDLVGKYRFQEVIVAMENLTSQRLMSLLEETRDLRLVFRMVPYKDDIMLGKANVEPIGDLPFVDLEATLYRRIHLLVKRLFDLLTAGGLMVLLLPVFPVLVMVYGLEGQFIWGIDGRRNRVRFLKRGPESLRRVSLLWSIFRGDLSFVGGEVVPVSAPDPQLLFKPGLTGLVQLRKEASQPEVSRSYQHYYLQHQSLTFDVEILLKAVFRI
ncbi:hypothetical protein ES708_27578 [subsurface metagenome]